MAEYSSDIVQICLSSDVSQFSAKLSTLSIGPSLAMQSRDIRQGGSCSRKTYLAILAPSPSYRSDHLLFIRVPLHSLLSRALCLHNPLELKKHYTTNPCLHPSELTRDFKDFLSVCGICTSSVGGLGPFIFLFKHKQVLRYNLLHHQPPHKRRGFHKCANMAAAIKDTNANALCVQIGVFLYVLTYAGGNQPVLQKYDIEKDNWTLVKDNIITRCNYTDECNLSMNTVPHVVINRKLHISLGYNSFAFDTEMDTWEYSNLFDTFWSHHNPFDFYGQHFWGHIETANWEFAYRSFGFYGRGIVWDEDILLGVLRSPKCQLVAFQLIDNKVVKSQSFTFADHLFEGAKLVDLGQGYFGLLHYTISFFPPTDSDFCYQLELVTILVSKPLQPRDECFLECRIVRKDIVAQNLYFSIMLASDPFSV